MRKASVGAALLVAATATATALLGCQGQSPSASPTAPASAAAAPSSTPAMPTPTPDMMSVTGTPSTAFTTPTPDNETVLKVNMVRGFVDIYVNDELIGKFGKESTLGGETGAGLKSQNLSKVIKPGLNNMRLVWNGEQSPIGEVHVSYSEGNGYREIAGFNMDAMTKAQGEQKLDFQIPENATPSSSTSTPVPGSTPSGDKPSDQAGPGSRKNQTLMTANLTKGHVTVTINGQAVGSYSTGLVPLDVSNYVKSGENKLTVTWDGETEPLGSIDISYAREASKFSTIANFDLTTFSNASNSKPTEVIFNLP